VDSLKNEILEIGKAAENVEKKPKIYLEFIAIL